MNLKMIRKRGGRSYTYRPNIKLPSGWAIEDESGRVYESYEVYLEANKPKKKVAAKKTAPKVED